MTYFGEIAHELPGRIRIRVAAERGDAAFFDRLVEDVASTPNIVEVRANAHARSLTVCGDGGNGPVRATLERAGLFEFRAPSPQAAINLDIDLNNALAIVLSGLGLVQLAKGRVTSGASGDFWHAYRAQVGLRNPAVAFTFAALGLIQLARGRYLDSASSLFFHALSARHLARGRAPSPGRLRT